MAELMVDFITSLDGFGAAEGWPGLWGMGGADFFAWLEDDAKSDYTLLMGAITYTMFAGFAKSGTEEISDLTRRRKIVFSASLTAPLAWDNSELARGGATDVVRTLKEDGEGSLRTLGSLSLCRTLLTAGLVDRYRVVVFPVVNGATGRDRIYQGWPDVSLRLVGSRTFDEGLQLFEYVPTVLDGPPAPASA